MDPTLQLLKEEIRNTVINVISLHLEKIKKCWWQPNVTVLRIEMQLLKNPGNGQANQTVHVESIAIILNLWVFKIN